MLLFCYNMAQVIKAANGTTIVQYKPFQDTLKITAGNTYKASDGLKYLQNKEMLSRYADYKNMDDNQRQEFYTTVDNYINAINSGKADFSQKGISLFDNTLENLYTPLVNEYFKYGIYNGDIPIYDESDKTLYTPQLVQLVGNDLYDNPKIDDTLLMSGWNALDPKDNEGKRGISNRTKRYAEIIRKEANKLETTLPYTQQFRFNGWQDDLNAYQKEVEALRAHANDIEKLTDINDESWIQNAIRAGLDPEEVKRYFKSGEVSNNSQTDNQNNSEDTEYQKPAEDSGEQNNQQASGYDYFDPLSENDIIAMQNGKSYTLTDSTWQNINDDNIKQLAQGLIDVYARHKIEGKDTFWDGYRNKYLQNLSAFFTKGNEISVYSVSNGVLTNKGKQFFIRTPKHQFPVKVNIRKQSDNTYTAKDSAGNVYQLGEYSFDPQNIPQSILDLNKDLGNPIPFNIKLLLSGKQQLVKYLEENIIPLDTRYIPPKMFAKMVTTLSYYFLKNLTSGNNILRDPRIGVITFGGHTNLGGQVSSLDWNLLGYKIRFEFKNGKVIRQKNSNFIDPRTISKVIIDRNAGAYKKGGMIPKFQEGSKTMVDYQRENGIAVASKPISPTKQNKSTRDLSKKQQLASDNEFTAADKVRTVAAGLDLLSSFLAFPQSTKLAAAAGTAAAFGTYITADIMDIIEGRQNLGDVALNDALLLGTMAVPMFINPKRAAALGVGEKGQQIAATFSKFFGWAVAGGMIANEETRKSLENTVSKLTNFEFASLNSQDATNIAFMVRLVAGVKDGISSRKSNKEIQKVQEGKREKFVNYSYKVGDTTKSGKLPITEETTSLEIPSLKESILKQLNEGREEVNKIKAEDITIPTVKKKGISKLPKQIQNLYSKVSGKEIPETAELAEIELGPVPKATSQATPYSRIFEKASIDKNGVVSRKNTPLGKFIRETLGATDFDVFFSDYNIVRNYRMGKLARLNKNVYQPLDDLRKQGKVFNDIIKNPNLTTNQKNKELANAMVKFGFLESDPGLVNYAKALSDFYETDLSRYDNFQLAQAMFDAKSEEPVFGKPVPEGTTNTNTGSKINTKELNYNNQQKVTLEDLTDAYEIFLREKQATGETNPTFLQQLLQTQTKNKNDNQQLVQKVFSNFNTDAVTPLRIQQDQMIKLLLKTNALSKVLENETKALSAKTITKALKELVKDKKLTQEQADKASIRLIRTRLAREIRSKYPNANKASKPTENSSSNTETISRETITNESANNQTNSLNTLEAVENRIKEEAKNTSVKESVSTRLKNILDKLKSNETIDENMYQSLKSKHFNTLKKLIPKHYEGGNLDFVDKVLKLQSGNRITWTSGKQNWFTEVAPQTWNYLFDTLSQEDSDKLYGTGEGSIYDLSNQYYKFRYNSSRNIPNSSEDVKQYQNNFVTALPSYNDKIIGPLIQGNRYTKNGEQWNTYEPDQLNQDGFFQGVELDKQLFGNLDEFDTESLKTLLDSLNKYNKEHNTNITLGYDNKTGVIGAIKPDNIPEGLSILDNNFNLEEWRKSIGNSGMTGRIVYDPDSDDQTLPIQTGRATIKGSPIDPLRILGILGVNAVNADVESKTRSLPKKEIPDINQRRVFRDILSENKFLSDYGGFLERLNRPLTSDGRGENAATLNAYSKLNEGLRDVRQKAALAYEQSVEKAEAIEQANNADRVRAANANYAHAIDTDIANKNAWGNMRMRNAKNWFDYASLKSSELSELQKVRNYYGMDNDLKLEKSRYNLAVASINKKYYNQILEDLRYNPVELEKFKKDYNLQNFTLSPYAQRYLQHIRREEEHELAQSRANYSQILNAYYNPGLYWGDISYPYYKGAWTGDEDVFTLQEALNNRKIKHNKTGGTITMAKNGGASINWVRVENARMVNKSIQNDIKHTHELLKESNKELQRSIREVTKLINKLHK